MSLWDGIVAEFGYEVPHGLRELEVALPSGLVGLQIRWDKGKYYDQAVEITFADSGKVGSVMGRVREEHWVTAKNPFFLLSPKYERFYVSKDKETMRDYMAAMKGYEVELENLQEKFERDQRDAQHSLEMAEKELAKLDKILEAHDADWTKAGFMDDIKVGLHMEKISAQEKIIGEARAILRETSPPRIDSSYIVAVRTAGLASIDLKQIVESVSAKKKELMDALGVMPKTKTEIPVTDTISLVVDWA